MSNLQTYYHCKLDFENVDQHTGGQWLIHNTQNTMIISFKAWNSPVEYFSWESQYDIEESEGNLFNPIIKENVNNVTWYLYPYHDIENPEPHNWNTVKPVCNDHLYNKIYYLWYIQ